MEKNNKLGFIKIIKLYFMKDTIEKMKKKTSHKFGENICKTHSNKRPVYAIYKVLSENSAIRK